MNPFEDTPWGQIAPAAQAAAGPLLSAVLGKPAGTAFGMARAAMQKPKKSEGLANNEPGILLSNIAPVVSDRHLRN